MEDNVAGGVAGAVPHIEHKLADCHLVAVEQPAIGREGGGAGDAILCADLRRHVDPEFVVRVGAFDRHTKTLGEHAGEAAMVDMAVRHQQLLDRHLVLGRHLQQMIEIAAGIGEGTAHGFRAPDQGAVLLQRGDGNDDGLERALHKPDVGKPPCAVQPPSPMARNRPKQEE